MTADEQSSIGSKRVLLLNASEEILAIISWKRAINLILCKKANRPFGYDHCYQIRTPSGSYPLPSAVMLSEYVNIPFKPKAPTRRGVLKRDQFRCQYCDRQLVIGTATIDHILPESRGGKLTWTNAVACCRKCNLRKGNRLPEEAGLKLLRKPRIPTQRSVVMTMIEEDLIHLWTRWIDPEIVDAYLAKTSTKK